MKIRRRLGGEWVVVTRYRVEKGTLVIAEEHRIDEEDEQKLEQLFQSRRAQLERAAKRTQKVAS